MPGIGSCSPSSRQDSPTDRGQYDNPLCASTWSLCSLFPVSFFAPCGTSKVKSSDATSFTSLAIPIHDQGHQLLIRDRVVRARSNLDHYGYHARSLSCECPRPLGAPRLLVHVGKRFLAPIPASTPGRRRVRPGAVTAMMGEPRGARRC
jgi:hypothetical protein